MISLYENEISKLTFQKVTLELVQDISKKLYVLKDIQVILGVQKIDVLELNE